MKRRSRGNRTRDYSQEQFEADFVRPKTGRALICGSRIYGPVKQDRRALYAEAVGADLSAGEGVDTVVDLEEPRAELGKFAHVDCLSILEHARRPWLLARTIERVLEPSGTLFLLVPFAWRVHAYPNDYWRFTVDGIRLLFPSIKWLQLGYLHRKFSNKEPRAELDGFPVLPRCEVIGFGRRRSQ